MEGMGHDSRRYRPTCWSPAGRVGALALTACLLVACSSTQGRDTGEAAPQPAASRSPSAPGSVDDETRTRAGDPAPTEAVGLPEVPSTDPAALAQQLELAVVTLQDPASRAAEVRRAGELHQLAVRAVAVGSERSRRKVTSRLAPPTARLTLPAIGAARELRRLTDPQPKLPRWRIVAPPPPGELLAHYRYAQRRTGVPWTYLAAIHLVETRMGRIRGTSTAGARGPMQFIPSTWELYGGGGDIDDPRDAILAAARLLESHGAPGDMADALWHYNPSGYYVRAVSAYARTMQRSTYLYRGYWHWRVLYSHERGTYVLPVGYPKVRPELLRDG
jgi:soluble lytic murein transglycosylase-like protein